MVVKRLVGGVLFFVIYTAVNGPSRVRNNVSYHACGRFSFSFFHNGNFIVYGGQPTAFILCTFDISYDTLLSDIYIFRLIVESNCSCST